MGWRHYSKLVLAAGLALGVLTAAEFASGKKTIAPDEQRRALHALNRLTFGQRPGDVQRVLAIGVDKWIEQQLHPEKIDDSAMNARLQGFSSLRMNPREMAEAYPSPFMVKAVMDGRRPMPSDPVKRAVYQTEIERLRDKQERQGQATAGIMPPADMKEAGANPEMADGQPAPQDSPEPNMAAKLARREQRLQESAETDPKVQELLAVAPDQRIGKLLAMPADQRQPVMDSLKGPRGQQFMEGMSLQNRTTMLSLINPQQVVMSDLVQSKLMRAIYSERQLDEVMSDFWFNHFNVFIGKGAVRYYTTEYERDVIRPHALGKFEDLLVATAKSPAMLFYLDNWQSEGPKSEAAHGMNNNMRRRGGFGRSPFGLPGRRGMGGMGRYPGSGYPGNTGGYPGNRNPQAGDNPQQRAQMKRSTGLNENYGRELLELHTLGVNGGYTQKDVTEVAKVFTGWTIEQPQQSGEFKFDSRMHEPGDKLVLDRTIKNHGEKEGLEVLHLLAHHPATARFISTKLAMRFVSDEPPPALIDRMAETFLKKDGDIREVLKTMFRSPEFWAPAAYRAKMKTPFDFIVSAVRATGAEVTDATPLARQLMQMGMPPYMMQTPNGYSLKADPWVNTSALLGRMNFAVALAGDKLRGISMDPDRVLGAGLASGRGAPAADTHLALAELESTLLGGDVSRQTHDTILKQMEGEPASEKSATGNWATGKDDVRAPKAMPETMASTMAGLILGSPEFQRR